MVGREKLKIAVKWPKIFPVHFRSNQQEANHDSRPFRHLPQKNQINKSALNKGKKNPDSSFIWVEEHIDFET